MGCDHPSPEGSWAGLTLHLFRSIKVLEAPGPAWEIVKVKVTVPFHPAP